MTIRSVRMFGGAERRFARLFTHLHQSGHDITLFCTADAMQRMSELDIDVADARVHVVDLNASSGRLSRKWNRVRGIVGLFAQLRGGAFDHVHIAANPGPFTFLYSIGARWLPAYSFSLVDSSPPELLRRSKLQQWFIRRSVRHATRIDCLSRGIAANARRFVPTVSEDTLRVSPCSFTDLSRVVTSADRDIDFLFLGRFTPGKGVDVLADAIAILHQKSERTYSIHVCGHGELPVSIPGAQVYVVRDSFAVMSRAKVFLSVQQNNNYPSQSLLEAMASECAVIATDVGETRQILDESCAELIPYDAGILAETMIALAADEPRRIQLGAAARKRILQSHTVERFADYFTREICMHGN
jgi:glycosyltransferase involved in cell wall biosynthesis